MKRHQHSTTLKRSTMAIALGLAGLCVANEASAFVAYEDKDNKFTISGRIAMGEDFNTGGTSSNSFYNGGSRINLVYQHHFHNDWTVLGRWEEAFDPFFSTSDGDGHANNDKYIALSHPNWGTFSVGKQDNLLYQFVDVFTDQPWWYADYTETVWSGNEINGLTERVPDTLKYVNTVGRFTFGALYGWSRGDIKNQYQLSEGDQGYIEGTNPYGLKRKYLAEVGGQFDAGHNVTLGTVVHRAHMEAANGQGNENKHNVTAWNAGVNWAPNNWYLSAVGGYTKNADLGIDGSGTDATHWGAFAGYTFKGLLGPAGDLQPYYDFNLQQTHGDKSQKIQRNIIGVADIAFNEHLIVALEHMFFNDGAATTAGTAGNHDSTTLFVRYNY